MSESDIPTLSEALTWQDPETDRKELYARILSDYIIAELSAAGCDDKKLIVNDQLKQTKRYLTDQNFCATCKHHVPVPSLKTISLMAQRDLQSVRAAIRLAELAIQEPARGDLALAHTKNGDLNRKAVATALSVGLYDGVRDSPGNDSILLEFHTTGGEGRMASEMRREYSQFLRSLSTWLHGHRNVELLDEIWYNEAEGFDAVTTEYFHSKSDLLESAPHPHAKNGPTTGSANEQNVPPHLSVHVRLFNFINTNSRNWYVKRTNRYFGWGGPRTPEGYPSRDIPTYFQVLALLDSAVDYARRGTSPAPRSTATLRYPLPPREPTTPSHVSAANEVRESLEWFERLWQEMGEFISTRSLDFDPQSTIDHERDVFTAQRAPQMMGAAAKSAKPISALDLTWNLLSLVRTTHPEAATAVENVEIPGPFLDMANDFVSKFVASSQHEDDWESARDELRSTLEALLSEASRKLGATIANMALQRLASAETLSQEDIRSE